MTERESGSALSDTRAAVSPQASRPRGPIWAVLISTFFGMGRLRPGPGTWASAVTVLLWYGAARYINIPMRVPVLIALVVLITIIAIPAATRVVRATGLKDPQYVVSDEVAGQLTALIAVPVAWKTFLLGFILFRAFDIVKPPPVRQLEKLPEGAGIVFDDLAAGIYALAMMQVVLRSGLIK